jgi:hypothetical protein
MFEPVTAGAPTQRQSAALVVLLVLLIAVPATMTLGTVKAPGTLVVSTANPTPFGYTVSLFLFILPVAAIAFWLFPTEGLAVPRQAFWLTMGILVPLGCGLDFFFAVRFFVFENAGATLGIAAPAIGGTVPIEEYVFYVTGFLTALLLYIWADEYWLNAYQVPAKRRGPLIRLHWTSLVIGAFLIIAAILFKKLIGAPGFPGYFMFIVLLSFVPSSLFMPVARPAINWRAFSATLFFTVLVALLWEVTLAAPYHWWGYQHGQMVGIFIKGWSSLPVEAVLVWISLTYSTVICFHTIKQWLLDRKPLAQLSNPAVVTAGGK